MPARDPRAAAAGLHPRVPRGAPGPARSATSARAPAANRRVSATVVRGGGAAPSRGPAGGPVDARLAVLTALLVAFGLLMVYSASSVLSLVQFEHGHAFLASQGVKALLGFALLLGISRLDYHLWPRLAPLLLWASLGLLVVTVVPGTERLTPEINGARRWIALPGFSFQPSELLKLATVLWMASTLVARGTRLGRFTSGALPLSVPPAIGIGLLVLQPDFGSGLFLALVVATLLFLGGVPMRHLAALAASSVPAFVALAFAEPYRVARLAAFLHPERWLDSLSYQVYQSLISLGSGGLFGVGIGGSRQKFLFLPEAHTDFIFAIIGEELGFLGTAATLVAFLYLGWLGVRIARRAPDELGTLLAGGLTAMLVLGGLFNIGVATANLPTTGLTLPFVSYGATSLTVSLAAVGVLLNVSRPRRVSGRVVRAAAGEARSARPLLPRATPRGAAAR